MNCLVIKKQNEQNNLAEYIGTLPFLELVATCNSVFEAYEYLQFRKIELIFLDTDLPGISGIDFIKSLDNKPLFIFLSSNVSLAIEGFNLNALDFLLKPFSYERFLKAANKALMHNLQMKRTEIKNEVIYGNRVEPENQQQNNDTVMVKTEYQTIMIKLDNILYIEGLKDYIKIYTLQNTKPIITLNSLKKLQQNLPARRFSRIHKSYIVGHEHIKAINKSQVLIHNRYIPIGESYKDIFMNKLEEFRI